MHKKIFNFSLKIFGSRFALADSNNNNNNNVNIYNAPVSIMKDALGAVKKNEKQQCTMHKYLKPLPQKVRLALCARITFFSITKIKLNQGSHYDSLKYTFKTTFLRISSLSE